MSAERKITVHVDKDLLARAQKASATGVTETVRKGLAMVAAGAAYDSLLKLRGKLKLKLDLDELRADRR